MKWPEGSPVGEVTRLAQSPPRPALRLLLDSVSSSPAQGLREDLVKELRSGRELIRARREQSAGAPLPTTVEAFDHLLRGGIPRGQLVEVFGRRSSGRFSAVLGSLAAATDIGESAALVDLGDGLDPVDAQRAGVALERLLWLRPTRLKDALHGAEMLLDTGFSLVVLDLGNPPLRGSSRMAMAWVRLARAAQKQQSALLVASPYRVSGAAASVVLRAHRGRPRWSGAGSSFPLLQGLEGQLALEKIRGHRPGERRRLELCLEPLPPAPQRTPLQRDRGGAGSSAGPRAPRRDPKTLPQRGRGALRAVAG